MDFTENHFDLLLDLLLDVTDIFIQLTHDRVNRHPQDFYLRCEIRLCTFKANILPLYAHEKPSDADIDKLHDAAVLFENMVDEKTVSHKRAHHFGESSISHIYPRLFTLRKSHNVDAIRFSSATDSREHLIKCLSSYCSPLQDTSLHDAIDEDAQLKLPKELLDEANHFHRTLTRYWNCPCFVTSHLVSLNLGSMDRPQSIDDYMKFNILFSCSDKDSKWQEGEISVCMSSRIGTDTIQLGVNSRRFITKSLNCAETERTANTFCNHIKKARTQKVRLSLQIDGDIMSLNPPRPKELHVQSKQGLRLSQVSSLFESQHSKPSTAKMNRLALVLAYTLLRLYDDNPDGQHQWISPDWVERRETWKTPKWTDYIYFYYQEKVKEKLDIQQPYLLSQTNGPSLVERPAFDYPGDLDNALHPAPGILALGKVLLELLIAYFPISAESNSDSEPCQTEDEDSDEEGSDYSGDDCSKINDEYYTACDLLEKYKTQLQSKHHWYYQAINACFQLNLDPTLSVREYIYKNIVKPLELNYHINSPSYEQVQERLNEIDRQRELSKAVEVENAIREGLFDRDDVCLYGDDEVPIHSGELLLAKTWFEWLQNVHTKVYGAGYRGKKKVKIAILDTGIELSDDQRAIYERQDSKFIYKSWVDDNEEGFEKGRDDVGHGTHLATLLKRVAQHAVVHVARVFKERKPNMATEVKNVAKAIRYAVDKWDVEIIVMSFGFEDEQDSTVEAESILQAIRYAHHKDVTLFAAASNDGHNRPDGVAWPARAAEVICVHAADREGIPKHTPGAADGQRVMLLGECVGSSWPQRVPKRESERAEQASGLHVRKDFKYMSGTSCAAPIAAGIAAIVLDYAQDFLKQDDWKRIRRVDGMKKIFEIMKDPRTDVYWWVRPWDLFRKNATPEWIQGEISRVLPHL